MNQSPQTWVQDEMISVLSFDGGGIRGLSSLLILQEVMQQATGDTRGPIYAWQYFTIICGTSTGGLIALMLGRLRMSIDEAITAYVKLGEGIFSPKKCFWKEGRYKAKNLERAIKRIIGETQQPKKTEEGFPRTVLASGARGWSAHDADNIKKGEEVMMMDNREDSCKTFVCAMASVNLDRPTHFRTYPVTTNAIADCRIWEAARATSASPYFFKPMVIRDQDGIKTTYVDGGLRCNNPTRRLIEEMDLLGLSNKSACILSIGTGQNGTISLPKVGNIVKPQMLGVSKALRKIATDCEEVERYMAADFRNGRMPKYTYVRLNVEQGMQGIGLEEWRKYGQIMAHTRIYLRQVSVQNEVKKLQSYLQKRPGCK